MTAEQFNQSVTDQWKSLMNQWEAERQQKYKSATEKLSPSWPAGIEKLQNPDGYCDGEIEEDVWDSEQNRRSELRSLVQEIVDVQRKYGTEIVALCVAEAGNQA